MLPLLLSMALAVFCQADDSYRTSSASGHLTKPAVGKFSQEVLKRLKAPKGLKVSVYAKDLGGPRMMVVTPDNRVIVSRPKEGDILLLQDKDGDGAAESKETLVAGQKRPHGLALKGDSLYFVAMKTVFRLPVKPGAKPEVLIDGLPDVGQHENRAMAIGPDDKIYVAIASTCNNCDDPTDDIASMLRFGLDGGNKETFATGLRDTIGFDWHPQTKELYGMDHGVDWHGDDMPPEEFNKLEQGKNYGWPFCYHTQIPDDNLIDDPEGMSKKEYCQTKTVAPLLSYAAHSAPIAMKFYAGGMFPEYQGSAFVAMHGSWNRKSPKGYNVVRVVFKEGKPERMEDFLTGFIDRGGRKQFGRPSGIAFLKDGSILVSEDSAGVIYRISR